MINSSEEKQASYDLVIIGGGINGAAVARDAALRGLKVILLEKADFGAGASTKTSKLAHGGLRYLEQYEFGLVNESIQERNLLLKNAPHLVHPLEFTFPVFSHSSRPLWQVNLGLYLYDFFAWGCGLPSHSKLTKQQIMKKFSGIKSEDLVGGCCYYDAQMKDNRLVIENILAAEQAGAKVLNYARVHNFVWEEGKIIGVIYRRQGSDTDVLVKCSLVINATGAWSNQMTLLDSTSSECQVAPTKGVHLVVPRMFETSLILQTPQDGRIFFVLPWEENSIIGATDTFFSGNPDELEATDQDVDYLLKACSYYFPHLNLSVDSIISTFVGLRPLVANPQSRKPSLVSRDHVIHVSKGRMVTILGGKFTTHRRMAEEVVDIAISQLHSKPEVDRCRTKEIPLPGALFDRGDLRSQLEQIGFPKTYSEYLLENYGGLVKHIINLVRETPALTQQVRSDYPYTCAEWIYVSQFEHVRSVEEWLHRRISEDRV